MELSTRALDDALSIVVDPREARLGASSIQK